jgi:hypothetical protein
MEARKITIVSTKTQKKSVIMSSAETLAELKADLDAANIDYTDMTFYEGTSKTELKSDSSVLPKDVPYINRTTGETIITNELVFMLTNTNKKIKSGALDRRTAYVMIKKYNLEKECLDTYGKNYTQCSTANLEALINKAEAAQCASAPTTDNADKQAREALDTLVSFLYNSSVIPYYVYSGVKASLGFKAAEENISSSYSDEDIDENKV